MPAEIELVVADRDEGEGEVAALDVEECAPLVDQEEDETMTMNMIMTTNTIMILIIAAVLLAVMALPKTLMTIMLLMDEWVVLVAAVIPIPPHRL